MRRSALVLVALVLVAAAFLASGPAPAAAQDETPEMEAQTVVPDEGAAEETAAPADETPAPQEATGDTGGAAGGPADGGDTGAAADVETVPATGTGAAATHPERAGIALLLVALGGVAVAAYAGRRLARS